MNLAEILRGLWRRWYVVFPGIILAAVLAMTAWVTIPSKYERTATQLLLPGSSSVPKGGNPYLYIGGLEQVGDVVVRAVGSEEALNKVQQQYPDAEVAVSRDPSTSAPVIVITVTSTSDEEAAKILKTFTDRTAVVLGDLQDQEKIPSKNQVTVIPLTMDTTGTAQQKTRIMVAAALGLGVAILALLGAALLDGLLMSRRRRARRTETSDSDLPAVQEGPVPGPLSYADSMIVDPDQFVADERLLEPALKDSGRGK